MLLSNLGRRKMAEATTAHGFWGLMRIARRNVEGDAFDRALAAVVEAQAALPMAAAKTLDVGSRPFPQTTR